MSELHESIPEFEAQGGNELEQWQFRIAKLELKPGDILVVKLPGGSPPPDLVQRMQMDLSALAAQYRCQSMIIGSDMGVSVIRPTEPPG